MGSSTGRGVEGDPDLEHLRPEIRPIACLPGEERLRFVSADRWIGYTRAAAALERLEELYGWPGRQRMPNMLLIGPTNNGKSMIIEKFRRGHPPISHPDREDDPGDGRADAVRALGDPVLCRSCWPRWVRRCGRGNGWPNWNRPR